MNAPAIVSRDECVLIDTTDDGRVRLTRGGATTYWTPATTLRYVALLEREGDEESRCIAAALRKAVERIGGAR